MHASKLGARVITVNSAHGPTTPALGRQYYALSDGHLHFIRFEDGDGNITSNNYTFPGHAFGVAPEEYGNGSLVQMLRDENKVTTLSALNYLGGYHRSIRGRDVAEEWRAATQISVESLQQAKIVDDLLRDADVRRLVDRHLNSDTGWISEAAKLVKSRLHEE